MISNLLPPEEVERAFEFAEIVLIAYSAHEKSNQQQILTQQIGTIRKGIEQDGDSKNFPLRWYHICSYAAVIHGSTARST